MSLIIKAEAISESKKIAVANTILLNQMKSTARHTFNMFWDNPKKTPQEIADEFGADAAKCFELHAKLQAFIYEIDNSWTPLIPPKNYTVNEGGTVTIDNSAEENPE